MENDLHPDEALLEYVLDDPTSFCITVTRRGAHVQALPVGRKEVEKLVQQFVDDVRAKGAGIEASKRLFRVLARADPRSEDSDQTHHCAGRDVEPASI